MVEGRGRAPKKDVSARGRLKRRRSSDNDNLQVEEEDERQGKKVHYPNRCHLLAIITQECYTLCKSASRKRDPNMLFPSACKTAKRAAQFEECPGECCLNITVCGLVFGVLRGLTGVTSTLES